MPKHVPGKHVLRSVPVRHMLGHVLNHAPRHRLKQVPEHMSGHMLEHVPQNRPPDP